MVRNLCCATALATRGFARGRLAACYVLGAIGYAGGLGLSLLADLPAGPLIVCTMMALGVVLFTLGPRARARPA